MPSLALLCVTMVVFGAAAGTSDVAMNAQGSALEHRMGTSIMSSLHGMWSIGGFVAAAIATVATRLDVSAPAHLAVMALVLLTAGQLAVRTLPVLGAGGVAEPVERPRFRFPVGIILVIALVGFCAVFGEVAGSDWSAVYMHTVMHSGAATAAATYGVFAGLMALGRLTGDRVVRRFGAAATVRIGAFVGTIGAVLVALALTTAVTIIGFALIGIGVATVVPLAFAAAGRIGAEMIGRRRQRDRRSGYDRVRRRARRSASYRGHRQSDVVDVVVRVRGDPDRDHRVCRPGAGFPYGRTPGSGGRRSDRRRRGRLAGLTSAGLINAWLINAWTATLADLAGDIA